MSASSDFSLTVDEAMRFLRDVLGMESPERRLETNQEGFLEDLMKLFRHHLPWQSISALSTPRKDRRPPTAAEIKRDMFAGVAGICFYLNLFGWMLLRALGFHASAVTCNFLEFKDMHVAVVVLDLTQKGSRHLVDFGNSYPTWRIIPLDFEQVSPEYHDSFLRYRFAREGDVLIRQHSVDTDLANAHYTNHIKDGWYYFLYIYDNVPLTDADIVKGMNNAFSQIEEALFFYVPRCVSYPGGRLLTISGTTLLKEDEEGVCHKTFLRSREDIIDAFAQHFPQFSADMIRAALADENVKLDFEKGLK